MAVLIAWQAVVTRDRPSSSYNDQMSSSTNDEVCRSSNNKNTRIDESKITPAIAHLSARGLHAFLFGFEHSEEHDIDRSADGCNAWSGLDVAPAATHGSRSHIFSGCCPNYSKAAAEAAAAGDGFCLLQRFVGPSGTRNSTLRCHWTASAKSTQVMTGDRIAN